MVAALTTVSCKCSSKKSQEPTQEEVLEMKQALADSVLAEIDALAEQYKDASAKSIIFIRIGLTDAEKSVKPDYLLDPSVAATLVTKTQKVSALAIYSIELGVRKIYDMPQEETKEAITKLAVEVNHPIDVDLLMGDASTAEKIKRGYEICKEHGDLAYFWQFQNAVIAETGYILAQNPVLFFSKITDEQFQAFNKRVDETYKAIRRLSQYDEEMAIVLDMFNQTKPSSDEERARISASIESEIKFRLANKDKFIAFRNALLQ